MVDVGVLVNVFVRDIMNIYKKGIKRHLCERIYNWLRKKRKTKGKGKEVVSCSFTIVID